MRCPSCFSPTWDQQHCRECGYRTMQPREGVFLPIGTALRGGEYSVGKVLGKPGGFGITYLAWDTRFDLKVAIKEYLPLQVAARSSDGTSVTVHTTEYVEGFNFGLEKFLDEAKILAHFRHPNIVRVMNFFLENGTAYMVMDYLEGQTLSEYLGSVGRITGPDAVALFAPVLDGVAHIHSNDYIHRDIKPSNIYLTNAGQLILLDFGSARQALREKSQNMTAVLTPGFAPWEQYHRKGKQGPWTDVYACAATLYAMVTGQAPPDGAERVMDDYLESVESIVPNIDAALAAAIHKGLAVNSEERPQTASEFQAMLVGQTLAQPQQVVAPSKSLPPLTPPSLTPPPLPTPPAIHPSSPPPSPPPPSAPRQQVPDSAPGPVAAPPGYEIYAGAVSKPPSFFAKKIVWAVVAVALVVAIGLSVYLNGNVTWSTSEGTYSGQVRWGKRHGMGTLVASDGSRYTSNWVDGFAEGPGELILPNGKKLTGTFDLAKKNAILTLDDGSRYEGGFDMNNFHGAGKLKRPTGAEYDGYFVNGKMNGRGSLKTADGTKYEGEFRDDELHGKVEITKTTGEVARGAYNSGRQDGEFVRFPAPNSESAGLMYFSNWRNGIQTGSEQVKPAFSITGIKTKNTTQKNEVLHDWNTRFSKNAIRFIVYEAHVSSLAPYPISGELVVKYISPSGIISRNASISPPDGTHTKKFSSAGDGRLSGGWGNDTASTYDYGTYKIQFAFKGVLVAETSFEAY